MPRIIHNMPKLKFPKYRGEGMESIDEMQLEEARIAQEEAPRSRHSNEPHPGTNYTTVKEMFLRSAELYGDRPFIVEKFDAKVGYQDITFSHFRRDVIDLGTGLTRAFRLNGEKIIIIGETTYEWYLSYMALLMGAGIAVPTDRELPDNELENIIQRADAAAVIFTPRKKDQIKRVANKCPGVRYFIEMYSDEPVEGRHVGLEYVKNEGAVLTEYGDNSFLQIEVDPDAFAVLLFTSGTTSKSKGVMLCNRNLAANINGVTPYVLLTPEDRFFSVLPLHHTYESTIGFLLPMAVGASVAVCQGLKHIVPNLQETHPTCLLAVPLLIETLYKRINKTIEKSGKAGLVRSMIHVTNALRSVGVDVKRRAFKEIYDNLGGRLRIIVSAAAPIDPEVGRWVEDIGIMFLQGYGLTETAPITGVTPDYDRRLGSAGKVVVCDECRIENPNEKGEGEILIRGDTLMLGYYQDPLETARSVVDGWFHSGDIGYMDADGYIYVTGRSKNVIVTQNGKNIYPEEIEGLLAKVEEISDCMVYGKEVAGEKELIITARVIPNEEKIAELYGPGKSEKEIQDIIWEQIRQVNRKLSNYKVIRKLEIKHDAFEKTSTMKIKRYVELAKDGAAEAGGAEQGGEERPQGEAAQPAEKV